MARLPTLLLLAASLAQSTAVWAETLAVPSADYPTVQAAVDAAADGDVIAIAPGLYAENVRIRGKDLALESAFPASGDPADVATTVIEGVPELDDMGTPDPGDDALVPVAVVEVRAKSSAPGSEPTHVVLTGLTIRGGDSGVNIRPNAHVLLQDCIVTGNDDGVELEGRNETDKAFARATVERCLIEANGDDGVDVDQRAELWIEDSIIRANEQDGIEIRLQDNEFAAGERIENVILRNEIVGNGQDGIQLIDYYAETPRAFRIERNVIADNGYAGLGMMCDARTIETFEACPIPERVELVHNTFAGNDHGLAGGANLVGIANLFVGHASLAVKNVAGASLLERSLFFGNREDHAGSTLRAALYSDPLLDADLLPGAGSPAVDAGVAEFWVAGEEVLELGCAFHGLAPDLGALERDTGPPASRTGLLLARASEGALEKKPGKRKSARARLDLGSKRGDAISALRFEDVAIPPDAEVVAARLELVSAKKAKKPADLMIGSDSDGGGAAALVESPEPLAARLGKGEAVDWDVPPWPAAGASVVTPDLAAVVQDVVDGPTWDEGNAIALFFAGTGKRSVRAFDEEAPPPLLQTDYRMPLACSP